MHRFIDENISLKDGEKIEVKNERIAHQLSRVLRKGEGDEIILCDGNKKEAKCEIKRYFKKGLEVYIAEVWQNEKEPEREVSLFLSVLKKDNFEIAFQKAVECGVSRVVPLVTERTVKTNLRYERLNKIALEASEQSGRGKVLKVSEAMNFKDAVSAEKTSLNEDFSQNEVSPSNKIPIPLNIFLHTNSQKCRGATPLHLIDRGQTSDNSNKRGQIPLTFDVLDKVNVWVGPEGGWSEEEVEFAKENGFEFASLGKLTLRAETAAIAASYLAVNL